MVGWLTSIPADSSHTHASPLTRLATALSNRNRTGSANAFNFAASSAAASLDSGSRTSGAVTHAATPETGRSCFDTRRY